MEQTEKERLAQLGCDRRLAEAVGNLDLEAATFTRIAGDENSDEAAVMQAASNYRAAVQRRNIAYDRACGIPEGEAGGQTATVTHEIDEGKLKEQVDALVDERIAALREEAATAGESEKAPPQGKAPSGGSGTGGSGAKS
jgi:hypothetical protein